MAGPSSPRRRRPLAAGCLVAALVVVALAPTSGVGADGHRRYLDPVFTDVDVTAGVPYRTATDCEGDPVELALDVHQPAGDALAARPLLVWIHGGSFAIGSRDGPLEVAVATDWARRGYVVASISYRLCPTLSAAAIEDAYEDAAAAVAWLRANAATYGIDVEQVVVGGASAGAITALQVGFTPDRSAGEGGADDPSHADAVLSMAGAWLPAVAEPGEPPVLMAHGTEDPLIPFASAEGFCTAAVDVGVDCRLHAYDAGHESLVAHVADIEARSFAFLYEVLGLGGEPSSTTTTTTTAPPAPTTTVSPSTTAAPAPVAVATPRYAG